MKREPSQGALMLVREMALHGASRGEIVTNLRDGFGIANADDAIDTVFPPARAPFDTYAIEKPEKKVA